MLGISIKGKLQFIAVQVDSECLMEAVHSTQGIPSILRIGFIRGSGLLSKRLGVIKATLAVAHASCVRVVLPALSVQHVLAHQGIQQRMRLFVRQLCRDDRVKVIWSKQLVPSSKGDQDVSMREASLLELYHIQPGYNTPKDLVFLQLFQQSLKLALEDTCHQVRTHGCSLAWQQVLHNLLPLRVASHCQKGVRAVAVTADCHCILHHMHQAKLRLVCCFLGGRRSLSRTQMKAASFAAHGLLYVSPEGWKYIECT